MQSSAAPSIELNKHAQVVYDSQGEGGDAAPLEFATGMNQVPEAVDMAVRLMTPQETSLVRASPRYAYDGRGDRPEVCSGAVHLLMTRCIITQGWTSSSMMAGIPTMGTKSSAGLMPSAVSCLSKAGLVMLTQPVPLSL